MKNTLKEFHDDCHEPAIKIAFHIPHGTILGTNHFWKTKREVFEKRHILMDMKSHCDYSEHL